MGAIAVAVCVGLHAGGARIAAASSLPHGVAAGDTSQTSTVFWSRSTVPGPVRFEYGEDPGFRSVLGSVTVSVLDPLVPVKTQVRGLSAGVQYYVRAIDTSGSQASGRFRTPPELGVHRGVRFGVSGDWRGELSPYPAIANVPQRDLDFFVELGDTIYADYPSPAVPKLQAETLEDFRLKHAEVYSERFGLASWTAVRASTSILAAMDDHEVCNDFDGGAPPQSDSRFDRAGDFINETELFRNGLQAFVEYNPIRDEFYGNTGEARTAYKRKLYRHRVYGSDAALFLLDTRSFRDEAVDVDLTTIDLAAAAQFVTASFTPGRTLLGAPQLADLQADLLAAQTAGIVWKFIFIPEPAQNIGPIVAADRFEGYAHERTRLLRFIDENDIANVVFIAADVHSTLVNNLTYQLGPDRPQIPTHAFEVTTGPVAFDAPFGPFVMEYAVRAGLVGQTLQLVYNGAPRSERDHVLHGMLDTLLQMFGYDPVGLDGSDLDCQLRAGDYVALHTYGWTEFEVDPRCQQLLVTTYGIDGYGEAELLADPDLVLRRTPRVVSQFTVRATLPPGSDDDGDGVLNTFDECPGTPRAELTDTNGCSCTQRDGDADGVSDCYDLCPASGQGDVVDGDGCGPSDTPREPGDQGSWSKSRSRPPARDLCGALGIVDLGLVGMACPLLQCLPGRRSRRRAQPGRAVRTVLGR